MNSCLQKFFKVDLCRSNSVLPFSFLHKEKLFQAGKAELSSQAMAFRNSCIPANSNMGAYRNSACQNMLKLNLLAVSLSTKAVFKI